MEEQRTNPYVGWRPFEEHDFSLFYGRSREAEDLASLVPSQRLVLLSAPSGAGKTSLINARIIPALRDQGFATLPIGRVGGSPEPVSESSSNVYVYNLILRLDENRHQPETLRSLSLSEYLHQNWRTVAEKAEAAEAPLLLIIDQFEEIVTTNQEHWQQRAEFFSQLRKAMRDDPHLWVLISIRDDYVEALSPYAHMMTNQLRTRYYLERLTYDAALEAVRGPADSDLADKELGGRRPFAPGVAEDLVDELRCIRVSGQESDELGEFIEPLQLQVVCYQIWDNVRQKEPGEITREDLQEFDAQQALVQAYERMVGEVIAQTDVPETRLRSWFETALITDERTRSFVHRGAQATGELDNTVVDVLNAKWLIRRSERAGGIWYELVHDSFIEPILKSNLNWLMEQPLLQFAERWKRTGEAAEMLLSDTQLGSLDPNWKSLGPVVIEYVERSQAEQEAKEKERNQADLEHAQNLAEAQAERAKAEQARADAERDKAAQQVRARRWVSGLAVALAIALTIVALMAVRASRQKNVAEARRWDADLALTDQLARESKDRLSTDPHLSLLLIAEVAERLERLENEAPEGSADSLDVQADLHNALQWLDSIPWRAHEGVLRDIAFDLESQRIYSAGEDGYIYQWDVEDLVSDHSVDPTSKTVHSPPSGTAAALLEVAFDNSGRQVVFQDQDLKTFYLRLNSSNPQVESLSLDASQFWQFEFSPDGTFLAAGNEDGKIRVFPVSSTVEQTVILPSRQTNGTVLAMAFSPDNKWLAAGSENNSVYLWRLDDLGFAAPIIADGLGNIITSLTFTSNESVLIAAGSEGIPWMLNITNMDNEDLETDLTVHGFQPEPDIVEGPSIDLKPLVGVGRTIEALDVDSSGRWLTAGGDGMWRWSLMDEAAVTEPPLPIHGHQNVIVSVVRTSPDGRWLVTADNQGLMRLWDAAYLPRSKYTDAESRFALNELKQRACRAAGYPPSYSSLEEVLPVGQLKYVCRLQYRKRASDIRSSS